MVEIKTATINFLKSFVEIRNLEKEKLIRKYFMNKETGKLLFSEKEQVLRTS